MEFLIANWFLVIVILAGLSSIGYAIYVFVKRPTTEQLIKVQEWLLYAVALAEREYGSGTGQIKLRYVYDAFLGKFPYLARTISFAMFSIAVDEALKTFKKLLETNKNLQSYINK